ncbi:MAG: fibronectin type III domain-containing protein [Candidatus Gracilibacteria bacterium]
MKNKIVLAIASLIALVAMIPMSFAADDLQIPSDVEGVTAQAGDGEVELSWDMTTDNVGVTEYKIYSGLTSVVEDGGSYDLEPIETNNDALSYTVSGLINDTTYYFAVTALDAAGNESEYYSEEVSATPVSATGGDTSAPYVVGATATNNMTVEVNFSEDVTVPTDGMSAFSIVNMDTDAQLEVIDAYTSDEDTTTVLVITSTQDEGGNYMLTVSSSITDTAGNPIVSGTSDTAVFTGAAEALVLDDSTGEEVVVDTTVEDDSLTHEAAPEDTTAPSIDQIEATTLTEIVVDFDEDMVLPEDGTGVTFDVILAKDNSALEVLSMKLDEEDNSKVILETTEQSAGEDYILTVTGITDVAGNELTDTFDSTGSFEAPLLEVSDLIPPEDVTNFLASLVSDVATSVELSWTASVNSAGDLADQLLYMSENGGTSYGDAESLGASTTSYTAEDLTEGQTYTFKLTTVDETGNESEGVITTVTLPQTGAGLGIVLLASVLGTGFVMRKK